MISIFVLEDDILQQGRIEKAIEYSLQKNKWPYKRISVFDKAEQLLNVVREIDCQQVFFLDIELKTEERKGFEVARKIREQHQNAIIVFVTTHSEFMPLTFQYLISALDFIDKSLDEEAFNKRIESVLEYAVAKSQKTGYEQDTFVFDSPRTHFQVPFDEILFFETSSTVHKVCLYTYNHRIEFYASIADVVKRDDRLFQCHRSFVINPANVIKIDKGERLVYFRNDMTCFVSRMKLKELLKRCGKKE